MNKNRVNAPRLVAVDEAWSFSEEERVERDRVLKRLTARGRSQRPPEDFLTPESYRVWLISEIIEPLSHLDVTEAEIAETTRWRESVESEKSLTLWKEYLEATGKEYRPPGLIITQTFEEVRAEFGDNLSGFPEITLKGEDKNL